MKYEKEIEHYGFQRIVDYNTFNPDSTQQSIMPPRVNYRFSPKNRAFQNSSGPQYVRPGLPSIVPLRIGINPPLSIICPPKLTNDTYRQRVAYIPSRKQVKRVRIFKQKANITHLNLYLRGLSEHSGAGRPPQKLSNDIICNQHSMT